MDKCYLFGAGINCYGVIKFVGKQNIIAVVDNNNNKIGFEIEGIPIIDFSDLLRQYSDETVIISAYYAKDEIRQQLYEHGIKKCIVAPYMQKGYYESYQELICSNNIDKVESIYIYGENYFSREILKVLQQGVNSTRLINFIRDYNYKEMEFEGNRVIDLNMVPDGATILLTTEIYLENHKAILEHNIKNLNIVSIYKPKLKKHYELQKFENIYKKRRCFIVGNGPSLNVKDLDILEKNNEICFGSNWILKVFDKTKWRPNFYVVVNYHFMRQMPRDLETANGEKVVFFHADVFNGAIEENENMYAYQAIPYEEEQLSFSENVVNGVYGSQTVTYDMIQFAAYMGFEEIYLLGVDCNDGKKHFYKAEEIDNQKLENKTEFDDNGWNELYNAWIKGYKKAQEYAEKNDFKIYNATRGGALEVFERVDFDTLF